MSITAQGTDNYVREASSLIVVTKVPRKKSSKFNPTEYSSDLNDYKAVDINYKLLMTKRSGKSSYLASAYVFPGGHVDLADFQMESWWSFYARFNLLPYIEQLLHRNKQKQKPRILTKPLILEKNSISEALAPEVAFRLAAIRETFEETGVLIAFNGEYINDFRYELSTTGYTYTNEYLNVKNVSYIDALSKKPEMDYWRNEIKKDANNFYKFCVQYDLVPNIFILHEWWNWSTPVTLGHKLFDTILYVTFLPCKVNSTVDNSEVCKIEWLTPEEMLEEHLQAKAFIAPPQIYELSRLANFKDFSDLLKFTINREQYGIERWSYHINGLQDGALLALPGDDKYPEEGNYEQKSNEILNVSLIDMREEAKRINRIELRVPIAIAYCNIKMPHGQVSPITFDQNKSKL